MPWFQKLCRQAGLAVHHATKPAEKPPAGGKVVMRRTTVIEEVELPGGGIPSSSASLVHREARDEREAREEWKD